MQAAQPGSAKRRDAMDRFLELGFAFVPTFNIYDANRDLMRARRADWHDDYTCRPIWDNFQPCRGGHGSYWYRWSHEERDRVEARTTASGCASSTSTRTAAAASARAAIRASSSRSTASASCASWRCCRRPASIRWRCCAPPPRSRARTCWASRRRLRRPRWIGQARRPAGA